MELRSHGVSDVGRRRKLNEDSFLADDGIGLYIVADGVGGHARGEVASAEAVDEVHGFILRNISVIERLRTESTDETRYAQRRLVESAVQSACYMVFGLAELDPEHKGMSTTMSALMITREIGCVAQVGDSRVYRLRNGHAKQLTEDHTLINYKLKHRLITPEQAARAPGKNVITRAVGHRDYVQVDTLQCSVLPGDRFLVCSDGLHGYLREEEVAELLGEGPVESAALRLTDVANERGGKDNITALVIDVDRPDSSSAPPND